MGFKLPASGVPKNVAVGDTVAFEIRETADGNFEITAISTAQSAKREANNGMTDDMKAPKK